MASNPLEGEIVSNPAKEDLGDNELFRSIFDDAQTGFSVAHRGPGVLRGHPILLRSKTWGDADHRSAVRLAALAR